MKIIQFGSPPAVPKCKESYIMISEAETIVDQGSGNYTFFVSARAKDWADEGKFKTPSLRNIALRAPYMHDGRFRSLERVMDFYSRDIENHDNLHPILRDDRGRPVNYRFNNDEQRALVAFLNTLTDWDMIRDEKYSDPFQ